MKTAKRTICALMMAALLLLSMGTAVFATEMNEAWLQVDDSNENVTKVSFVANSAITDGLITVTYDAAQLSYLGLEVNSDCVAYSSVNADTAGVIKMAWVSSGDYEAQDVAVFTLIFDGETDNTIAMTGELTGRDGEPVTILDTLYGADLSELKKAVLVARGLSAEHYTADSFEAMESALAAAEALLGAQFASQEDVDAAALALNNAIDALELSKTESGSGLNTNELEKAILKAEALDKADFTQESFALVEKALAAGRELLNDPEATQDQIDAAAVALNDAIRALDLGTGVPDTGRSFMELPVVMIMVLSAAGVVAAIFLVKGKKGRCAK